MSDEIPPLWALDMAAKAAGYVAFVQARNAWGINHYFTRSIIAHARTLAKYEKPPVDEAELKRRQDAREAAYVVYDADGSPNTADAVKEGSADEYLPVQSAYIMACMKDGVTPTPVSEWSDK